MYNVYQTVLYLVFIITVMYKDVLLLVSDLISVVRKIIISFRYGD